MPSSFDVVIIGSGFAGSLLGLILTKLGRSVLLIDRQRHPRFAIGESSTPAADAILESLCARYDLPQIRPLCRYGSWQRELPGVSRGLKRGFSYFHQQVGEHFTPGANHHRELLVAASANDEVGDTHWYRADVDAFLARKFVEAGGVLWEETTATFQYVDDHGSLSCESDGNVSFVKAEFLVDGTGSDTALVRTLGLRSQAESLTTNTRSLFGHFHGVRLWSEFLRDSNVPQEDYPYPCDQTALHHVIPGGWMWVLRFDNGITSVGWSLDQRLHPQSGQQSPAEEWQQLLNGFPSLAAQFGQAKPVLPFSVQTPLARTGRLQRFVAPAAGSHWALLPHTAGFIDPFYSTGIAQSLLGVERLAEILGKGRTAGDRIAGLMQYSRTLEREVRLIDRFIALAFRTMGRDPRLLHAASMLYFAAATTYELRRGADESRAFLLADNEDFLTAVDDLCRTFPAENATAAQIAQWSQLVESRITPWNSVGLFHPRRPHMYWRTSTK